MQDYQFKYSSHCLCIFYSEPFLFSAPTVHMIVEIARSFLLFSCSLNLITFHAPHLEDVLELMTLRRLSRNTALTTYLNRSQSILSTLMWVTAAFFQAKQRVLGRVLKRYIFVGTAWNDSSGDLMIHVLIWNSAVSG